MDDCGWECVWGLMDKGCGRGGIWMWADVQSMWKRMGCGLGLMYKVCGREWAIGRDYCIRDVGKMVEFGSGLIYKGCGRGWRVDGD